MSLRGAFDVIAAVRATGASVVADGELLRVRPASKVPAVLVAALRQRKAEIIAALRSHPEATSDALRCMIGVLTVPDVRLCPSCHGTTTRLERGRQVCAHCP